MKKLTIELKERRLDRIGIGKSEVKEVIREEK